MKEEMKLLVKRLGILQDIRRFDTVRLRRTRSALAREPIDALLDKTIEEIGELTKRLNTLIDKI